MTNERTLVTTNLAPRFANLLIEWQKHSGRNDLPWQVSDPYKIWVSEVMLQQTQVTTVLNYFPKFIKTFPDLESLAKAKKEEVLKQWAGLGYYSRAKNLHASAQYIMQNYSNNFPKTRFEWQQLKGIGRSTAAAIVAFAFRQREAILDGNVKRVLARILMLPFNIADTSNAKKLWSLAEALLPTNNKDMPIYTQGLMDLGATTCTKVRPLCQQCPVAKLCQARLHHKTAFFPINQKKVRIKKMDFFWPVVINQHNQIFLTERKNSGIWPGLLCPPVFETKAEMLQWLTQESYSYQNMLQLPTIKHQLTHRELSIYPFELNVLRKTTNSFYDFENALHERIPTPLKSFIIQRYLISLSS